MAIFLHVNSSLKGPFTRRWDCCCLSLHSQDIKLWSDVNLFRTWILFVTARSYPVLWRECCLFVQTAVHRIAGNKQKRDKLKYRQCGLELCNFQIKNKIAKLRDCHWMIYLKRRNYISHFHIIHLHYQQKVEYIEIDVKENIYIPHHSHFHYHIFHFNSQLVEVK